MKGWRTQIRGDIAVFAELADWWDARAAVKVNPFLSTRVLGCWVDGIDEPSSRLSVFLLHRHGELVAALPLYSARGRYRSIHKEHTEPFDVITVDDQEVIDYVPTWLDTLQVAHLYRVPASSPIVEAARHNPRWHVQSVFKMPYVDLSDGFDSVLARMSKGRRTDVRRCRRRLGERGEVRFVPHPAPGDLDSVLSAALSLQASGWKGEHGHAVLNNPVHERWYKALAEVGESAGWLRVSSLYLDDRLISFSFGLWVDGVAHGMLNAYDESDDIRSLSPGNILFWEVFAHAAEMGMHRYELGSGDDPWKFQWTKDSDTTYDLLLFGAGPRGRSMNLVRNLVRKGRGKGNDRDEALSAAGSA